MPGSSRVAESWRESSWASSPAHRRSTSCATTALASTCATPASSSRPSNACIPSGNSKASASGWRQRTGSSVAMVAAYGRKLPRIEGRASVSPCVRIPGYEPLESHQSRPTPSPDASHHGRLAGAASAPAPSPVRGCGAAAPRSLDPRRKKAPVRAGRLESAGDRQRQPLRRLRSLPGHLWVQTGPLSALSGQGRAGERLVLLLAAADVARLTQALRHRHELDRQARPDRIVDSHSRNVAARLVQSDSRQRGHHFRTPKAVAARLRLAVIEQRAADPATGCGGVHEEGTYLRRIGARVESAGVPTRACIPAEEGATIAPAAATHEAAGALHDEIGSVGDELAIEPEGALESGLDLLRRVIGSAQRAYRPADQGLNLRRIRRGCLSEMP